MACWGPRGCCGRAGSWEASGGEDRRGQGLAAFLAPWVLEEELGAGPGRQVEVRRQLPDVGWR